LEKPEIGQWAVYILEPLRSEGKADWIGLDKELKNACYQTNYSPVIISGTITAMFDFRQWSQPYGWQPRTLRFIAHVSVAIWILQAFLSAYATKLVWKRLKKHGTALHSARFLPY